MVSDRQPSAPARDNMPRAMAWMVLSGVSFALMGAMVKFAGDVPVPAKVFFRNLVTLIITGSVAFRLRQSPWAAVGYRWRLLLRSLCGLGGVVLYFVAIGGMNLADASLLNKTSPFFVAIFAVWFLREPFSRALLVPLGAAFLGAILVIKPRFDFEMLPALAGFASGMFAGMAYTVVRSLKDRVQPNLIILSFSLVSTLATLPFLIAAPPSPTTGQWWALIGTGVFGAGGQYGLTFAYHHARASRISIFTYLHVLFALVVGLAFWGEVPDVLSIIGGILIIGAALRTHRIGVVEDRKVA